MKVIDLSATIRSMPKESAAFDAVHIEYFNHAHGAAQASALLNAPASAFRNEEGWATEEITKLGTHSSTHVDAPWHYNSAIEGKPAATIDQLPLEWFFSDGVVLDMTHKSRGNPIDVADIEKGFSDIGYALKPFDIVLMRTGCDQHYGAPDYIFQGPGVTAEATVWLIDRGIRVMGIDAWGWDEPLDLQAARATEKGEKGIFWAAHQVDRAYSHIERLVNLSALPSHGFKVACFPLKIEGASAGPARVVAMVEGA
ncbi:cyclase family protein [Desulfosudis oleivorans]|uniref:Cyclase family protein n=1 Tax=Desulfosudis oleivorans (strain DSM 6200 / JCM 39069 / Hxd3) TaxID=96561 RepID=A9A0E5_DESOH|nr:cyclase family protein [Desulfosudis oleivorans]ABW67445.1 cyclase family protein [Desulfosudis oleivorans Hxd3]